MAHRQDLSPKDPLVSKRRPRFFYGWIVVAVGFLITAMAGGLQYSFGVFFKPLLSEFGWTRAMTSGAFSLYMIMHGVAAIASGWATDKYGPRITVAVFGLVAGLGLILCSQVEAIWQLYIFYGVIFGIGMSGTFNPASTTTSRWFLTRRGLALGIVATGVGLGTLIWAPAAERLIAASGWRTAYVISAFAAWTILIGSAQFLRRYPQDIGLVPYGQSESPVSPRESSFGKEKASLESEFTIREAVRTRAFWFLGWARFCFGLCLQMVMLHLVPYATDRGASPLVAATFLSMLGVGSIIGRLVVGAISDRIGGKNSQAFCFALMATAMVLLLGTKEAWMFYLFAAVFGFSYGGSVPQVTSLPSEYFGLRSLGTIMGLMLTFIAMGGGIGAWLAGQIFDITESYRLAFIVGIAAMIIAVLFTLTLRKPEKTTG